MWILLTVIAIFLPIWVLNRSYYRGYSIFNLSIRRALLILFFLPTAFGVFGTYFKRVEFSFDLINNISDDVISLVFYEYLISFYILLFLFYMGRSLFFRIERWIRYSFLNQRDIDKFFLAAIIFSVFGIYIFELLRIPSIPLIVLIDEGISAGSVSRGDVINYQIQQGIPVLGYLINFMPSIVFIWISLHLYINVYIKYFYGAIFIIYNMLFLGKAFFLTPILIIVVLRFVVHSQMSKRLLIASIVSLLVLFFSVAEDFWTALDVMLNRLFIGQVEGLFLIREYYRVVDLNAALYGFPLAKYFDLQVFDPSVEIVSILFGDVSGWVNMNSYGLGQGFVMLGDIVVVVLPMLIFLNVYLCFTFGVFVERYLRNGLGAVVSMYFIFSLPVNTNFSLLLYFKSILGVIVVGGGVILVRLLTRRIGCLPPLK